MSLSEVLADFAERSARLAFVKAQIAQGCECLRANFDRAGINGFSVVAAVGVPEGHVLRRAAADEQLAPMGGERGL